MNYTSMGENARRLGRKQQLEDRKTECIFQLLPTIGEKNTDFMKGLSTAASPLELMGLFLHPQQAVRQLLHHMQPRGLVPKMSSGPGLSHKPTVSFGPREPQSNLEKRGWRSIEVFKRPDKIFAGNSRGTTSSKQARGLLRV